MANSSFLRIKCIICWVRGGKQLLGWKILNLFLHKKIFFKTFSFKKFEKNQDELFFSLPAQNTPPWWITRSCLIHAFSHSLSLVHMVYEPKRNCYVEQSEWVFNNLLLLLLHVVHIAFSLATHYSLMTCIRAQHYNI